MKKFLALLLIAALTLSAFTACSKNDGSAPNTSSSAPSDNSKAPEELPQEPAITYPVEIENALGVTVIEEEVNAIAVFDVGMLDIIDTLGFGDRVVAVTHGQAFPDYLSEYDSDMYVNLGGFKDWDQDALINANPDLILAGFRQNKSINDVTAIAPTLYFAETQEGGESYIAGLEQRVNAITALFGGAEEAESYLKEIKEKIEKIKAVTAENEITFIILTAEDGGLSVGGMGSGSALLVNDLGLVNLYEDTVTEGKGGAGNEGGRPVQGDASEGKGGAGDEVGKQGQGNAAEGKGKGNENAAGERGQNGGGDKSAETAQAVAYVLEKNPAYIFVFDKDAAEREEGKLTAQEIIASAGLEASEAYKNGTIICVDNAVWSSAAGGLKSTIQQLDTLMELFGLS